MSKEVTIRPIYYITVDSNNEVPKYKLFIPEHVKEIIIDEKHKHPLILQEYKVVILSPGYSNRFSCDNCGIQIPRFGYRCSEGCDVDFCFDCLSQLNFSDEIINVEFSMDDIDSGSEVSEEIEETETLNYESEYI